MNWYYWYKEKQHGPVSETELKKLISSGALPQDVLVWNPAFKDWKRAIDAGLMVKKMVQADEIGKAVEQHCTSCGKIVDPHAHFCIQCGTAIAQAVPAKKIMPDTKTAGVASVSKQSAQQPASARRGGNQWLLVIIAMIALALIITGAVMMKDKIPIVRTLFSFITSESSKSSENSSTNQETAAETTTSLHQTRDPLEGEWTEELKLSNTDASGNAINTQQGKVKFTISNNMLTQMVMIGEQWRPFGPAVDFVHQGSTYQFKLIYTWEYESKYFHYQTFILTQQTPDRFTGSVIEELGAFNEINQPNIEETNRYEVALAR